MLGLGPASGSSSAECPAYPTDFSCRRRTHAQKQTNKRQMVMFRCSVSAEINVTVETGGPWPPSWLQRCVTAFARTLHQRLQWLCAESTPGAIMAAVYMDVAVCGKYTWCNHGGSVHGCLAARLRCRSYTTHVCRQERFEVQQLATVWFLKAAKPGLNILEEC